ncbi:hypothetical protein T484DRAFT_1860919 [Baffinella frigidus]|nr:hypothetical protein T484DRAFT_1860919 [Cryptophyta sp. CCMP2293]
MTIEIEDAITIHFMELHPQTRFETMYGLIQAGLAFDVTMNLATKQTSTIPCIARRDILARAFPAVTGADPTAMEVNVADDTTAESRFMQGILGESEYNYNLGHNFSHIIANKFQLNGKYIRGWWINPGYVWNQQQMNAVGFNRFTRIMVILLVALDDGTRRRRAMLATIKTSSVTAISYNVPYSSVVAATLRVPEELLFIWKLQMKLTHTQA